MRVSFLFWNLKKQPLEERVAKLAKSQNVDVVALAECGGAPAESFLLALRATTTSDFRLHENLGGCKTELFTRPPVSIVEDRCISALGGLAIRELRVQHGTRILLAVVHLPSRLGWSQGGQTLNTTRIAEDILGTEDRRRHRRTIIVGDFNMNPFDDGMVGANALHAVMTQQLAQKVDRVVQGQRHRFFYNPMWGFVAFQSK